MPARDDAESASFEGVFRREWGRVVGMLARITGSIELAEDAAQEAFTAASMSWPRDGVPANPAAWLTTAARRKAIDRLRREQSWKRRIEAIAALRVDDAVVHVSEGPVHDDRLELIFTCCHPALAPEAQVALTLRCLSMLTTTEIARAFLVPEATMAQRLVRAKRKISGSGIPFRVPDRAELPERVAAVLAVVYLVFNEGYSASAGDDLVRSGLAEEAIRLGELVHELLPDDAEVLGLLALMILQHSRRDARQTSSGELVLLEDQDRALWHRDEIERGSALVELALRIGPAGPYQIQAAIAACHALAPTFEVTDWRQIVALYTELARRAATPVVLLNRAVALGMADGPLLGLAAMEPIADALKDYFHFHSAKAEFLRRAERLDEARLAYLRAIELAPTTVERNYLMRRLHEVDERH